MVKNANYDLLIQEYLLKINILASLHMNKKDIAKNKFNCSFYLNQFIKNFADKLKEIMQYMPHLPLMMTLDIKRIANFKFRQHCCLFQCMYVCMYVEEIKLTGITLYRRYCSLRFALIKLKLCQVFSQKDEVKFLIQFSVTKSQIRFFVMFV